MLKGENYSSQLWENFAHRITFNTLLGGECGVVEGFANEMAVTYSGTTISINTGLAVIKGGILRNTTTATLSVTLGANLYYKVVLEIDLSQTNTQEEFNQGKFKLISNSGSYPTLTTQDIVNNTTSGIYQFELAQFTTSTTTISNFQETKKMLSYEALMQEVRDTIDQIAQEDLSASMVGYSNSGSGMVSDNVQSAIDELKGDIDNIDVEAEISGIVKTQTFNNTLVVPPYASHWGNWGTLSTPDGYTFVGFTSPQVNNYHMYASIFLDGTTARVNINNTTQNQANVRVQFKAIFIKTGIVS